MMSQMSHPGVQDHESASPLGAHGEAAGFAHPGRIARYQRRRSAAVAELIATLALILATAIAAIVVTIEIAEAGVLKSAGAAGGGVAFAALVGAALLGGAGFTAAVAAFVPARRRR